MPRPVWSGAISFGLVTIAIKVLSATEDRSTRPGLRRPGRGRRGRRRRRGLKARTVSATSRVIFMPIPVHALAHRPLTTEAVAELVALPTEQPVPDDFDAIDAIDAEIRQRGWSWEHERVCNSFRTGNSHVLCSEGLSPFGHPNIRHFLVFGELYPLDPDDESMTNGPWLYGLMDDWQQLPAGVAADRAPIRTASPYSRRPRRR